VAPASLAIDGEQVVLDLVNRFPVPIQP